VPNILFQLLAKQFFAKLALVINATLFKWLKIRGLVVKAECEFFNSTEELPLNLI
jgi:hypothetical protein